MAVLLEVDQSVIAAHAEVVRKFCGIACFIHMQVIEGASTTCWPSGPYPLALFAPSLHIAKILVSLHRTLSWHRPYWPCIYPALQ